MKKIVISLTGLLMFSSSFAFSTRIGGFAAIDLLDYVKEQGEEATTNTGIGVLDMKAYARHKDFSSKMKLDLDSKAIKYDKVSLVEELTVSWRPNYDWKITAGKGKAKFHRLHWGATEHCFTDGGTILGTANSYRDLDRRPVATVRYGNYRKKFMNHTSVYGNPSVLQEQEDGTLRDESNYSIDLNNERGFTNKLEWFPTRALSLSASALYYKHDLAPFANYAFDTGGKFQEGGVEIWFEYIYGKSGNHEQARYAKAYAYENTFQLGAQYEVNDLIDVVADVEGTFVNFRQYVRTKNPDKTYTYSLDPHGESQDNIKLDLGVKFKIARSTQITVGALAEKKYTEKNGAKESIDGFQLSSGLSMWF